MVFLDALNVLILIWTDAGRSDVWPAVPTTHLRDFAAAGLEFQTFVTQPVGSATVYSTLFGEYPFRNGNVRGFSWEGDDPIVPDIPPTVPSLPDAATAAGYAVALHGKWGLGGNDLGVREGMRNATPFLHGFSTWRAGLGGNVSTGNGKNYSHWERTDDGVTSISSEYVDEAIADAWIQWWRATAGPRFSVVWLSAGHGPWTQAPPASALPPGYRPNALTHRGRYEAMVVALDHQTGRMLQEVDLTDTLVVIFTTNGTPDDSRISSTPARVKRSCYEDGIRVPGAMRGPGVRQGTTDEPVSPVDLWAALADLTDIAAPPRGKDSVSFAPLLSDPEARSRRRYVFAQDQDTGAVRTRTHKLIQDGSGEKLFELDVDPGELRPIDPDAYANRELVRNLRFWLAHPGGGMVQDQGSSPPRVVRLPAPAAGGVSRGRTPVATGR